MQWDEFRDLLVGIGPDTALGRIVSIRSEDDQEILKNFTDNQRKIRNEWKAKHCRPADLKDRDAFLEQIKNAFINMAGGEK